jgi:hypothetical protein
VVNPFYGSQRETKSERAKLLLSCHINILTTFVHVINSEAFNVKTVKAKNEEQEEKILSGECESLRHKSPDGWSWRRR